MTENTESQNSERTEPVIARNNRRHAPDYIKPYEWAIKSIGTPDFKDVVDAVCADLNGSKEKPNFTTTAVETALRRLKADRDDVEAVKEQERKAELDKQAEQRAREQKQARLQELRAKYQGSQAAASLS
jgi:hypothetical protein